MPNNLHPHIQRNLHHFKETYQKPARIYRYLAECWKISPIFLNRTLSYVRKYRNFKPRKREASIDAWLSNHYAKLKHETKGGHSVRQNNQSAPNGNGKRANENGTITSEGDNQVCCYFNWICDDPSKTSQRTRTCGFVCPWCCRDCRNAGVLLQHLRFWHFRFTFDISQENSITIIEMKLNPSFDGSYCGFKYPGHDLKRDFRFTPDHPKRNLYEPITQTIFFRSKRINFPSIDNSNGYDNGTAYDDEEADVDVCSGRLYYHTSTCLPIKPNEGDIDSEADMDPEWLRERTQLMIDEFTDVNEGEKEIFKLWNLHIMRNYKYKGDSKMRQACLDFVQSEGQTMLSKNLVKNFILHLSSLFQHGLISSGDHLECIRMLRKLKPAVTTNSPARTPGKVKLERNSNEHCHSPPAKRALLNSHCNQ